MMKTGSSSPSEDGQCQWRTFLRKCLLHRLDVLEFKDLSKLLLSRYPISETALLDVLLESQAVITRMKWDPLLPLYIDCLRKIGKLNAATVLGSLLRHSSVLDENGNDDSGSISGNENDNSNKKTITTIKRKQPLFCTFMTDIKVMHDVILSISTGHIPRTFTEAVGIFVVVAEWILAVVAWHHGAVAAGGNQQTAGGLNGSTDAISLYESLGILLAALSGSEKGLEVLSAGHHGVKLCQALSDYLPLCTGLSLPLRNRLENLQKDFQLYKEPLSKSLEDTMMDGVNVNALQFEDSVMDEPVINSRAGLYIYVNAMLVGRPLVDDNMLYTYLLNRYRGQYEVFVEEIILAAFDVLSNAMYRNEFGRTMLLLRSFLVNKLPVFFAALSAASLVPIPMELCVSHALNRLDPNTFPSFSQMFAMEGNTVLSDVRQEFLFSCASHSLIPESSIERLLGENPMQTLPVGGPYLKDDLASQIHVNPVRAEQLIHNLDSMDGNAGAIVGAIIEVMHHLCFQKETVTLKTICNSLSRCPQALDVILFFRNPKQVLQPLCFLLDSWHWDEDGQGENQPIYDEFGSVLLLIFTFNFRYDLGPYDLGVTNKDSFVLKLLECGFCSQKLEDLTERQNKHIGAWIDALFIAEGISEETMSSCSPQEFYLLVSTLFNQSLGACEMGKLGFETLKGGFEYLLEPFLLPSLVITLTWLGNHIWESESDPTISLKILYFLVKPSSISGEADAIHRTVLSITARTLEEQLKDVRNRHPTRPDIKPILEALDSYHSFHRTGSCHHSELESWINHTGGGGLLGSIRSTFQSLVLWSTNPEISMSPHSYTHRQILAGIKLLGSPRVLSAIIDELKLQTEAGSGPLAMDIAATLVCSPFAESFALDQYIHYEYQQGQQQQMEIPGMANNNNNNNKELLPRCSTLTIRDALLLQHENIPKISEKDPLRAQVIVRLFRRVNSLLAPPSPKTPFLKIDNNNHNDHHHNINTHHPHDDNHHLNRPNVDVDVGLGVPVPVNVNVGMNMDVDVDMTGHEDDDPENIGRMFDNAAAAAAVSGIGNINGDSGGNDGYVGGDGIQQNTTTTTGTGAGVGDGVEDGSIVGFDTGINDVLNAADMTVENPEFLDLDMDVMF